MRLRKAQPPPEQVLRDYLVDNLHLIDVDLRWKATEHKLPNSKGSHGYIDILAQDGHDSWVIIEIKRSRSAARSAIHEVLKYAELLQRERGIRADRVRAIIVATDWSDLRTSASSTERDWSHDLRCYQLVLGPDGLPVAAEPVSLLPKPTTPRVSPIHHIYFFDSAAARSTGWKQIVTAAGEVKATELLAATFRRTKDPERVVADFGLYFAIGEVTSSQTDRSDFDEEYSALCHITSRVFGRTSESAGPGTFRKIAEDDCWTIEDTLTTGRFVDRQMDPVTELDPRTLARELNGDDDGLGSILFTGSARTKDRGRWPALLREYALSLRSNKPWQVLVKEWLEDVASSDPESDVTLHIYNPADLLTTLVYGWPDQLIKFVPMIRGIANHRGRTSGRVLEGGLLWDGKVIPDLADAIRVVYADPTDWAAARTYGIAHDFDEELLDLLGLKYVLFERRASNMSHPLRATNETTLRITTEHGPRKIESPFADLGDENWQALYGLAAFLREHYNEISSLVAEYRFSLSIPS